MTLLPDAAYHCLSPISTNPSAKTDPADDPQWWGAYQTTDPAILSRLAAVDLTGVSISQIGNINLLFKIRIKNEIPPELVLNKYERFSFRILLDLDGNPATGRSFNAALGYEAELNVSYQYDSPVFRGWWSILSLYERADSADRHLWTNTAPMIVRGNEIMIQAPRNLLPTSSLVPIRFVIETRGEIPVENFNEDDPHHYVKEDHGPDNLSAPWTYNVLTQDPAPSFNMTNLTGSQPEFNENFPATTANMTEAQTFGVNIIFPDSGITLPMEPNDLHLFTWHQKNFTLDGVTGHFKINQEMDSYTHMGAYVEGCDVIAPLLIIQGKLHEGDEGNLVVQEGLPIRPDQGFCTVQAEDLVDPAKEFEADVIFDYSIEIMKGLFEGYDGFYLGDKPIYIRSGDGGGDAGQPIKMGYGSVFNCNIQVQWTHRDPDPGFTPSAPGAALELQSVEWKSTLHELAHNWGFYPGLVDFRSHGLDFMVETLATTWSVYLSKVILYDSTNYPIPELTKIRWHNLEVYGQTCWEHARLCYETHPEWTFEKMMEGWNPAPGSCNPVLPCTDPDSGTMFDAFHYWIGVNTGWNTFKRLAQLIVAMEESSGVDSYYDLLPTSENRNWNFYVAVISAAAGADLSVKFSDDAGAGWKFPIEPASVNNLYNVLLPLVP